MEKKKEIEKHHPLRISNATNGNKYMTKPISELDLTECKQCTPSYRLLPENVGFDFDFHLHLCG
jgi:paired amphipathic helix protein Sin3a